MPKPSEDHQKVKYFLEAMARNCAKIVDKAKLVQVEPGTDPRGSVSEKTLRFAREMVTAYRTLLSEGNVKPALEALNKRQRDLCDEYEFLTNLRIDAKIIAAELGEAPKDLEGVARRVRSIQNSLRRLAPPLRSLRRLTDHYGPHGWFGGSLGDNMLLLLLGFDSDAALKESMEEIEGLLGKRLLKLAEDENALRQAIAGLNLKTDLFRRLVHADVLSSMVDDDWNVEVDGRREIVEYVLATHTLYRLLGVSVPLENSWDKSLHDLLPSFPGDFEESHRQLTKWIMRQHAKNSVSPERIQVLMKCLKLDLMTRSS